MKEESGSLRNGIDTGKRYSNYGENQNGDNFEISRKVLLEKN